jgi:hypothetical protein
MAIKEIAGRPEPLSVKTIALRHFGEGACILPQKDGTVHVRLFITPPMAKMAGFITEVRKVGNKAIWDAGATQFIVAEAQAKVGVAAMAIKELANDLLTQFVLDASIFDDLSRRVGHDNVLCLCTDKVLARRYLMECEGVRVYKHANGHFYAVRRHFDKVPGHFKEVRLSVSASTTKPKSQVKKTKSSK